MCAVLAGLTGLRKRNDVTSFWQLSVNAIEYPHSSAKFYICGQQGIYPVLNYRELDDINLNSLPW